MIMEYALYNPENVPVQTTNLVYCISPVWVWVKSIEHSVQLLPVEASEAF